jgi:hypothetical protein
MSLIQGGVSISTSKSSTGLLVPSANGRHQAERRDLYTFCPLWILFVFDKHKRVKVTGRRPVRPWRNSEQCGFIWYVGIYVTYIHIYSHTNKPRFLAEQVPSGSTCAHTRSPDFGLPLRIEK